MMRSTTSGVVLVALVVLSASPVSAQQGGVLNVNLPVSGVFTPDLPIDATGKPFIDYHFVVSTPGTYQFDLVTTDSSAYDPYLILMQNGGAIANDDDGGSGFNARLVRPLVPGYYVVRVTRFGQGPVMRPVAFSISITAAMMTGPPSYPAPSLGLPMTESLARTLASQFYNTQSEWAGQYAMTIAETRLIPTGATSAEFHVRYFYSCMHSRCRGSASGVDQRVFYFQRYGSSWQVVQMGGHMSASF